MGDPAGCWLLTGNPKLRAWLDERGIGYVLAVACDEMIITAAGPRRADELATLVPGQSWQRLSCACNTALP